MRRPPIRSLGLALILLAAGSAPAQDVPPPAQDVPPPAPAVPPPAPGEPIPPQEGESPIVSLLSLFFDVRPGPLDEARIAGLPAGSKPGVLGLKQAYDLAIARPRGAKPGRFETLDAGEAAIRAAGPGVEDFARFREDFASSDAFVDPSSPFLDLQSRVVRIENDRWYVASLENWMGVLREMVRGEASGLSQFDVDGFDATLSDARRGLGREMAEYRDRLDRFKVTLGLSPHAPITIDLASQAAFRRSFEEVNRWHLNPNRTLAGLAALFNRLPTLGDVVIDGRSILREIEEDPDRLEEVLALATRAASRGGLARAVDEPLAEVSLRDRIRHLAEVRADYRHAQRMSVLAVRQLSDIYEQIITPPAGSAPGRPARPVLDLAPHARRIAESRSQLVSLWNEFNAGRLALYRDLGTFPFADWTAFSGQFDARPTAPAGPEPEADAPPPPAPIPPPPPPLQP
ncbi:hypothetical protein TA3x_005477 [Tundrisphaera sp. TA3]|uniref:hypothetical protein n=1 Tax=Tundrisphaera sp. TA3 TaxID=3435775 RepID=UPI003EB95546